VIVRPAIDIREGQCVQLVGGSYDDELIRLPDPEKVALEWIEKGFTHLHVIDLDRATNRGSNIDIVRDVIETAGSDIDIRVGGGIRSLDDISEILTAGASSVVVGTQAIKDPQWFAACVENFPGDLNIALEVDGRDVKISGWQESTSESLEELIATFNAMDLAGIFVTAIHKEGRRAGTDLELFSHIRSLTHLPIVASGGVTTSADITELKAREINEVVLGAAIYTNPNLVTELQAEQDKGRQP
jgi:phosphoribosylformimino-5-aminoimidazole carboxamide ribotide isomerase